MQKEPVSRRSWLKGGIALAGANLMHVALPSSAMAQAGEEVLPWLDQPPPDEIDNVQPWESLDSWITPSDRFFNVNHYGQPTALDESTWQVQVAGRVSRPYSLSLSDIRARPRREVDFTIECSGNNGFANFSSAVGNARWTGTPLAPLLRHAGILDGGVEVVFYGVDSGPASIRDNGGVLRPGRTGRTEPDTEGTLDLFITEQFARSMSLQDALHPANMLCYEMNGVPLPAEHGFPVRLIAPGWFGIANVKWLTRIEIANRRYAGRLMARDYVSIREQQRDGQTIWTFNSVGPILLKSAPGRVVRRNGAYLIRGAAWGAPIGAVQVQIDGGRWMTAKLDPPPERSLSVDDLDALPDAAPNRSSSPNSNSQGYAWTLWNFRWGRPEPGEHTVCSRSIDIHGNVQPAPDDPYLASKVTYWESNGQITRRVLIP